MLRSAKIRYTEIMILHRDLLTVTRYLAGSGSVEIIPRDDPDPVKEPDKLESLSALHKNLATIGDALLIPPGETSPDADASLDPESITTLITTIEKKLFPLLEKEKALQDRIQSLKKSNEEFAAFKEFQFDFSRINTLSYLFFKYGTVPTQRMEELQEKTGQKALVIPVRDNATEIQKTARTPFLAISSKKGRFALETALSSSAFQESTLPAGLTGVPATIIESLNTELETARRELEGVQAAKQALSDIYAIRIQNDLTALLARITLLKETDRFDHTHYTTTIRCWIPASRVSTIRNDLDTITSGKAALEETKPNLLDPDFLEKHPVPVLLKNRKLFKPFEFLISNFGYPEYGEIEPTPIVGIGFLIMFGIMFGDVGQGGVLFLTGLIMALSRRIKPGIRQAGMLIAMAGVSASFFGLVFGSVFCNPHLIHPLWKEPLANPDDILTLFGATIGFGILWINVGLLLNMVNRFRARDWKEAFLEKTGLPGIVFYWGAVYLAIRGGILKQTITGTHILLLTGLPLFVLFLKEPLHALFSRKPLFEQGAFTFVVEGLVELIDTLSYFMGNTVSFVRVGAFALAHGGLSLAFMKLYELVGGGVGGIIVLIFGNILIIVLEGMVVSIQTMRLEYYEFFSKFYSGNGRPFTPFTLTQKKGA